MPRAVGLMNPENAQKSAGPFKEGFVRINHNSYIIHKANEEAQAATKWAWSVTRLREDGETPLTDEHDNAITEELYFSFGGKSLANVHPGKANGPDDPEPDDLGTDIGVSGNTIYITEDNKNWKPSEKSGLITLTQSLLKLAVKEDYINRCWSPDWDGCILEMKSQAGDKGPDGRSFNYKIASKVLVYPGGSTKSKGRAGGVNGSIKTMDPESILAPILAALADEYDGQQVSRKTVNSRVRTILESKNLESALYLPVLKLAKDDSWMARNGETLGYTLDAASNSLYFGSALPNL